MISASGVPPSAVDASDCRFGFFHSGLPSSSAIRDPDLVSIGPEDPDPWVMTLFSAGGWLSEVLSGALVGGGSADGCCAGAAGDGVSAGAGVVGVAAAVVARLALMTWSIPSRNACASVLLTP